ncbi:MAG TPA: NusG domain II-containing protein [Tenericutes bacterium]|nr:NusG domain II-containing protein [Mycoplasmatota bacterium]
MNKNDKKISIIFLLIAIIGLIFIYVNKNKENNYEKYALVYYNNDLILKIDLNSKEEKEYKVKGHNGEVIIKSAYGKVKVEKENSPLHLCSKQGYITSTYETIVCLPNKIVIKIDKKNKDDIDTMVR